jgi:hypothetical protein
MENECDKLVLVSTWWRLVGSSGWLLAEAQGELGLIDVWKTRVGLGWLYLTPGAEPTKDRHSLPRA